MYQGKFKSAVTDTFSHLRLNPHHQAYESSRKAKQLGILAIVLGSTTMIVYYFMMQRRRNGG